MTEENIQLHLKRKEYNQDLIDVCYENWRSGYKRTKGKLKAEEKIGRELSDNEYSQHFRKMFDDECLKIQLKK